MSIHKTKLTAHSRRCLLLLAAVIGAVLLPRNTGTCMGFVAGGMSPTKSSTAVISKTTERHPVSNSFHSRSFDSGWHILQSATTDKNEMDRVPSTPGVTQKRILLVWLHAIVGFVVWNYYTTSGLWPSFFLDIPGRVWSLLHALSAMVFAGGIITTTLLEWQLPSMMTGSTTKDKSMLLQWLWQVESKLVLPAVSMSLVSGVVQAFDKYTSLRTAPPHVKGALHIMALFAVWWAWTDRRSQASLREDGFDDTKVNARRLSNLVSCAFLVVLYGMMILKPGF